MDKISVRAVFRIILPHDGYGEIRSGHLLGGEGLPFPQGAAVVLEVGAGYWCRGSELERIALSLATVRQISITGTDIRKGGTSDGSVITGLGEIAAKIAHLIGNPVLFDHEGMTRTPTM